MPRHYFPDHTEPDTSGDEIGLSPSLVPTVCAIIVAVLAALQFAVHVMAGGGADETALPSIHFAFILIAITGVGLAAFRFVNAETGCSLLAVSAFLFMGERRPLALVSMAGAVATIIFLAQELGI